MTRRRCSECGAEVRGRLDRQTCSPKCRMARSRRLFTEEIQRLRNNPDPCAACKQPMTVGDRGRSVPTPQALLYHPKCWDEIVELILGEDRAK